MLVFISYPREYQRHAERLESKLRDNKFDVFFDREKMHSGDKWENKIKKNIKEANIFVILYNHESDNKERFFKIELEDIKDELKKDGKMAIPVRFLPTQQKNLPVFLEDLHIVEGDENNNSWITEIIKSANIFRKEEQNKAKKIIKFISIILATVVLGLCINEFFHQKTQNITDGNAKTICKKLIGDYVQPFGREYDYVTEKDVKGVIATSAEGTWKTDKECIPGKEGSFILKGKDSAIHQIKIKINGQYERVADGSLNYASIVTIGEDGILRNREIYQDDKGINIDIQNKRYNDNDNDNYKKQKVFEYKDFVEKKLRKSDTVNEHMKCIATLGKDDEKNEKLVAFICPEYIRVMVSTK